MYNGLTYMYTWICISLTPSHLALPLVPPPQAEHLSFPLQEEQPPLPSLATRVESFKVCLLYCLVCISLPFCMVVATAKTSCVLCRSQTVESWHLKKQLQDDNCSKYDSEGLGEDVMD